MVLPPAAQARVVGFPFPHRSPGMCFAVDLTAPLTAACAMAELRPITALFLVVAQSRLRGHGTGSGPVGSPSA